MKSTAATPEQYLAELPEDRREPVARLRGLLLRHLPAGFEETMGYGMLAYVVPHTAYPDGYHCDPDLPLPFMNLASQKQYISLYHMGLYDGALLDWLRGEWPKHTDARLDMGRCCLRFRKPEQIPYDLVAQLAGKMTPQEWVRFYEGATRGRRKGGSRKGK